jgi:twitching motility two-component system response regulator PilH
MPIKHVLVMDDFPIERDCLNEILAKAGFMTAFALSGEEGVITAKGRRPDRVATDVVMPDLDGFRACRAMTQGEQTRHIPLLPCATKNQGTNKNWAMRQCAKAYVPKPADGAELLKKISALG